MADTRLPQHSNLCKAITFDPDTVSIPLQATVSLMPVQVSSENDNILHLLG